MSPSFARGGIPPEAPDQPQPLATSRRRPQRGGLRALRATGLLGVLVIAPVAAQDGEPGLESLGDPLEIERYVDTNGDDAVVEALTNEDARLESRLGAIRAAPWLTGPERALGPLARLAAGDDPDLAPAAARAGQRCAEAIAVDGLTAREEDPALLGEAAAEWQAVADDETARPDVRAVAAATAQALSI